MPFHNLIYKIKSHKLISINVVLLSLYAFLQLRKVDSNELISEMRLTEDNSNEVTVHEVVIDSHEAMKTTNLDVVMARFKEPYRTACGPVHIRYNK